MDTDKKDKNPIAVQEKGSSANHDLAENGNQSSYASGTVENHSVVSGSHTSTENGTSSQEFTFSDVQELVHHIQLLQLQLKQANNTFRTQNEKQKETASALYNAKQEIVLLQDSITQKDKLLNDLVEKMTLISTEYGSLKQSFAQISQSRKDDLAEEVEEERKVRYEVETALNIKLEEAKSEKESEIQELVEMQEAKIGNITEEYEVRMKDIQSQLEEFTNKDEENKLNLEKMMNENVGLQSYCDTLTKGLEFLKEEHEKCVTELNELSVGFKVLKSEYDILNDEKVQQEIQGKSWKAELDTVEVERQQMHDQIYTLNNMIGSLEKDIKETNENLERIKVEHHQLLQDRTVLADETAKLETENTMYKSQIAEYEDKFSESEEVFNENHSLHGQNDELNNKINNQKDLIASLRNEIEVLTVENSQGAEQIKDLSASLQQIKKEDFDLKVENELLLTKVTNLKDALLSLKEENLQYKDSQLLLNEEIQNLRQCLANSSTQSPTKVPLLLSSVQNKIESSDKENVYVNSAYENHIMVNEEALLAEENFHQNEAIPNVFSRQKVDECTELVMHEKTPVEKLDNDRKLVTEERFISNAAKTSHARREHLQDSDVKIAELEGEIKQLKDVMIEIQASKFSKEILMNAQKLLQSDHLNETCDELDKTSAVTSIDDTAYESLQYEHTHLNHVETGYAGSEVDILTERLVNMEQEFNKVTQTLYHKTKECEELQEELQGVKHKLIQDKTTSTDVCRDNLNDSVENHLNLVELPKVSETSSVTSLEKEVNMHASSPLCSVQNDGVFSLDSLPGIKFEGDCNTYVDKDTFQNVTEGAVSETTYLGNQQKVLNELDRKVFETERYIPERFSREFSDMEEQMQIKEMEIVKWKDAYNQMLNKTADLDKSVELFKIREESLKCEIESKEEIVSNMKKDLNNFETVTDELRVKMKKIDDSELERKEKIKELKYENEKLSWENDEMNERMTDLETQLLDMKTVKSDIEFQKFQYEEELNSVKERLEYLESSDNDIIEIKDMFDKVQEERENILRENEKLQCLLSARIEENEKILETVECLQKENATSLERLDISTTEINNVRKELVESNSAVEKLEKTLLTVSNERNSQQLRFESEIEGLLEENSTLKTSVQMKIVECETLKAENEQLQRFCTNIDQESENSQFLKKRNIELEERVKKLCSENENIMTELMETQDKVADIAEENELLLDKCEEFQRVIVEIDNEKTSVLESVERTRQEFNVKLKENCAIIEKYESQLESLDQENSTLKTQVLSLHQEMEENHETENGDTQLEANSLKREKEVLQQENIDYKETINGLQQNSLSLAEQIKLNESTVFDKEVALSRLEAHVEELCQENLELKEKYDSIESDYQDLKDKEIFLREQMKIYESALNSDGEGSGQEIERLNAQLELERNFKARFEKDLEQATNNKTFLENRNKEMQDRIDLLDNDLKLALDKKNEAEEIAFRMRNELDTAQLEKKDLKDEKFELHRSFNEVSKGNEVLKVEICTLQSHLEAISDNRNHIRNQVEILAAEVENLRVSRDLLQTHVREANARETVMSSEYKTVSEKSSLMAEENEKLERKLEKLLEEIEVKKSEDCSTKKGANEDAIGMKEEINVLHSENETLTHEIRKLKVKLMEKEEVSLGTNKLLMENETLRNEIKDLKSENEDLKEQNNEMKISFQSLQEKIMRLDKLIKKNIAAELENDSLGERLDMLHERISEMQKEKQALKVMTDDLTNTLHDMQTKYEEVKSEMESTKKKCDKEINHLQKQLHEMNEDVSELRKMLDYMENEMYSNAEEKNILKENLEQQQTQFAEVCEQKQKLEDILSDKQQKDLKNLQMASQRQKNNSFNTSRSEQDIPCNEQRTLQDSQSLGELECSSYEPSTLQPFGNQNKQNIPCNEQRTLQDCGNQQGSSEMSGETVTEVLRDSIDSDISDIIPSFESAFHLLGLASSCETVLSSRMIQTNISVRGGEYENSGFLLDDNGENTENYKEISRKDCGAQTETVHKLSLKVLPNIDINGIDSDGSLVTKFTIDCITGNVSNHYNEQNTSTSADSQRDETMTSTEVVEMYKGDEKNVDSGEKCQSASQVQFQTKSLAHLSPLTQSSTNPWLLSETLCLEMDNEEIMTGTFPADVSVLSADSGILSACAQSDGRNPPFQYPCRNLTKNSDGVEEHNFYQNEANNFGHTDKVDGKDNCHGVKEIEFSDICIQTDINFEDEIENATANLKERLEAEFKERIEEMETEIEKGLLEKMESREEKVQLLEENYDKKVKQMEYDIEEKYEQMFRMREVEIVMEAEKDKKAQAAEVKNAAEIEIERVKREKDQQFVKTLQTVKADLAQQHHKKSDKRRTVSDDKSRSERNLKIGPGGDVMIPHDGTFQKLAVEHKELALERDALLQKIKTAQTEQESLCQQLLHIMGEHNTMGNDKQPKQQQAPSWLDWDLHPDFSFGSMRSSLDTKSLSGSLDTSSFCSNSECLNVRMKYEHLIDKIKQFLKVRSAQGQVDATESSKIKSVNDEGFDISDTLADRFEENDEHESQILQRLTSIDLETFVRIPSSAGRKSGDQFVYEVDDENVDPCSTVELNSDIIDRLITESDDSVRDKYNSEGRFSENEDSDEESECDISDDTKHSQNVNQCRSSVSFIEEDGHFCQEEDAFQLLRKKRHFSDSDIKADENIVKVKTSQSENNEGHFVFERSDSQIEKNESRNKELFADDSCDDEVNDNGVFEEIEANNVPELTSDPIVNTGIQSGKKLEIKVDEFINESNDDKPPGLEEVVISERREPQTGEETGDFFEERIEKSVVLNPSAMKYKDTVAESVTSRRDLTNTDQNLKSDLSSSVKQECKNGQQSYENTVFDILNAICPGTDPGRRPGTFVASEDTFFPVIGESENTADEFSESSGTLESNLQSLKAELGDMKLELKSLAKENSELKNALKLNELDNKKDVDVLVEKISELEDTNREQADRKLESEKLAGEQYKSLKKTNRDLSDELDKCKKLVLSLEVDLKQNSNLSQELEKLKNELGEERNEKMTLKKQCMEIEKLKKELELKCCEVSSNNDKLLSDCQMLDSLVKKLETESSALNKEKTKLIEENDALKSVNEENSELLRKQEELQINIIQLQNEKKYLDVELKNKTAVLQAENDKLEQTLIAQADMYDSLEKDMKVIDTEKKKLNENFEKALKENETFKARIETEENENKSLREDLEKETLVKMELKLKKDESSSELSALMHHFDVQSKSLTAEIEKLKVIATDASENINVLKEEKEELNNVIHQMKVKEQEKERQLQEKDQTINELHQSNQDLIQQVEKLEVDTRDLQSAVIEMTAKVNELTKENEHLHDFEKESQVQKEINESLRNDLVQMTKRNDENEWAIRELAEQAENQKKTHTVEQSAEDENTEVNTERDGKMDLNDKAVSLSPQQKINNICLVDCFSNTDSFSSNVVFEEEMTALKEEVAALRNENTSLKQNFKEASIEEELQALKLENETLKRSLDFAIVKDDSDTDLQIFEDMKDAIRTMQAEKSSVEKHEREMSDNMELENKRLRDEIEELYAENDVLKKKLKNQEETARKENGEILKMYSDLRNEVEILVISKHDLEVELHALKDLLEHDPYPTPEKVEHDTSRELTLQDLEEMEELKRSIEKLKFDLKEKDTYVKKLEEHLLNMDGNNPELTSTPKPSHSRGVPLVSKSFLKRGQNWLPGLSRRAYSQDIPSIAVEKEMRVNSFKPDFERSQTLDTSLHVDDLDKSRNSERYFREGLQSDKKLTSSVLDSLDRSPYSGSVDGSERIRSRLKAEEDGHLALELKQFELVAEITKLRRDFRETKALYSKETSLLTEALEKEKLANELRGLTDLPLEHSVGSNLSHDVLKLRKQVARLREQNELLNLDCDMWIGRLKEQEQIVADLKERTNQNASGYGEIEEVFGRQLALLQKQREELVDKLKERERENCSLSETLGEKGILEETLRKEKDVLVAKLKEKGKIEEELSEKKLLLVKQAAKQKELEDVVYQKDLNEIELMKQKRILEEELREIESRFREKEESLDFEKNKLLNELREKRTESVRSSILENDDEVSSVCSESAAFSDRNIGRLEFMLEEVEKQHSVAVNVLRDQLCVKYNRREKALRKEHAYGLKCLNQDSSKQVN